MAGKKDEQGSEQPNKFIPVRLGPAAIPIQSLEKEDKLVVLGRDKTVGDQKGRREVEMSGDAVQSFQVGCVPLLNFMESGSGHSDQMGETVYG